MKDRFNCRGNETGYHTCGLPLGGCGDKLVEKELNLPFGPAAEQADRIVKVWRCVGDGNDDELLRRYIAQAITENVKGTL